MIQLLIVIGLLLLAFFGLSIGVLFMGKKGPIQHVAENKALQKNGIHCATSQDREAHRGNPNRIDVSKLK